MKISRFQRTLVLVIAGFLSAGFLAAEEQWSEDFEASRAAAKEAGKPILMLFTGSDWCPPCKMLESRVYPSAEFQAFADGIVLFKADFPNRRELPEEVSAQNRRLQQQYEVPGYPTTVILSPEGEFLGGFSGFRPTEEYLEEVKAAIAKG